MGLLAAPLSNPLFDQRVVVGVADLAVSNNPNMTLSTFGLGSCVGVAAYDPNSRVGGLLHIMLPDSSQSPEKAEEEPCMYADTGVQLLCRAMSGLKANLHSSRFMVAGGATIIEGNPQSDLFHIGTRNVEAVVEQLQYFRLSIFDIDTGGSHNRTMHLTVGSGYLTIKSPEGLSGYNLAKS